MCKLRPCTVRLQAADLHCVFHCWEQVSQIVPPSPMRGGHSGGVVAQMYGLVEDESGKVFRVNPTDITFEKGPSDT